MAPNFGSLVMGKSNVTAAVAPSILTIPVPSPSLFLPVPLAAPFPALPEPRVLKQRAKCCTFNITILCLPRPPISLLPGSPLQREDLYKEGAPCSIGEWRERP